jgi:uncharacterized membrane protein required for colicin V production
MRRSMSVADHKTKAAEVSAARVQLVPPQAALRERAGCGNFNAMPEDAAGRYELIFLVSAAAFICFQMVHGWRLGVVRQMVHLFALVVSYLVAIFSGKLAMPLLRFIGYPDIVLSMIAGLVLAGIVYVSITAIGTILFRRTNQQNIRLIRLGYGAGGSLIGLIVGFVTVWLVAAGIRMLGAVAEAEVTLSQQPVSARGRPSVQVRPGPFVEQLARMKESLDQGTTGAVMQRIDPLPESAYLTVGKIARVISSPERITRFLDYPGARALSQHPRIVALQSDPLIIHEIEQRHYLALLKNENIVAAANDSEVNALVKRFDLEKALDYALGEKEKSDSARR